MFRLMEFTGKHFSISYEPVLFLRLMVLNSISFSIFSQLCLLENWNIRYFPSTVGQGDISVAVGPVAGKKLMLRSI